MSIREQVTNFQTALDDSQAELETTIQEYEDAIYILHGEINHYEQIFNKLRNLADQPDAEAAAAALSDVPQLATPPHARATPRVSASASDGGVQGRERVGSEAPVLERRSRALSEVARRSPRVSLVSCYRRPLARCCHVKREHHALVRSAQVD